MEVGNVYYCCLLIRNLRHRRLVCLSRMTQIDGKLECRAVKVLGTVLANKEQSLGDAEHLPTLHLVPAIWVASCPLVIWCISDCEHCLEDREVVLPFVETLPLKSIFLNLWTEYQKIHFFLWEMVLNFKSQKGMKVVQIFQLLIFQTETVRTMTVVLWYLSLL